MFINKPGEVETRWCIFIPYKKENEVLIKVDAAYLRIGYCQLFERTHWLLTQELLGMK